MVFAPLLPSEFELVNFPNPMAIETSRIKSCGILNEHPGMETLLNVVYYPAYYEKKALLGGFLTLDGMHLDKQSLRRAGKVVMSRVGRPDVPTRTIDEPVLWLGWAFNHFGHFLLEGLSRMWALEKWSGKVAFHMPMPDYKRDTNWRLLQLMGVSRNRIIDIREPTLFRTIHCPETAYEIQWAAHPCFIKAFQELAQRLAQDVQLSDQPLYLSRSRLPASRRRIEGEATFEQKLADQGFKVYHPQENPIEEQIRTINSHRHIVATNGSAAHMILFSLQNPQFDLLTQERLSQDFFLCSKLAGAPTSMVHCINLGENGELTMDLDFAYSHLTACRTLAGAGRRL